MERRFRETGRLNGTNVKRRCIRTVSMPQLEEEILETGERYSEISTRLVQHSSNWNFEKCYK